MLCKALYIVLYRNYIIISLQQNIALTQIDFHVLWLQTLQHCIGETATLHVGVNIIISAAKPMQPGLIRGLLVEVSVLRGNKESEQDAWQNETMRRRTIVWHEPYSDC